MNWIIQQLRRLWNRPRTHFKRAGSLWNTRFVAEEVSPIAVPDALLPGTAWLTFEERSPFAVPSAFFYILDSRGPDSGQTAELVSRLMLKVRPYEWTQLYREFRWIHIAVEHVTELAAYPADVAVELLGIATLNSSGHVRQAALERLSSFGHSRAIPYIILRLGDWVPQVRQAAEDALTELLANGQAAPLLEHSYLIDWLERVDRVDLSGVRSRILASLRSDECRGSLLHFLKEGSPDNRLFCYRVIEDEIPGNPGLVDLALSDPSPAIRRWIVPFVLKASESQAVEWLPRLLKDKSVRVRTEVLHWLPATLWPIVSDLVQEQMFSESSGVRSAARFLLNERGIGDFADRYRHRLGLSSGVTAGTLAGLCETGDKSDWTRIEPFADHVKPKVREAVIVGLGHLDVERAVELAARALNDTNARVRHAAVRLLRRVGGISCRQRVLRVLEQGNSKARCAALSVVGEMGGWESLRDILFALTVADEALCTRAWGYLEHWIAYYSRRLYTKLARELATEIGGLVLQVKVPEGDADDRTRRTWTAMRDIIEGAQRS